MHTLDSIAPALEEARRQVRKLEIELYLLRLAKLGFQIDEVVRCDGAEARIMQVSFTSDTSASIKVARKTKGGAWSRTGRWVGRDQVRKAA